MPLCKNRPEGFGPHSAIHPRLPTNYFVDVIVVPLPTWIFILALALLIPLNLRRGRSRPPASKHDPLHRSPSLFTRALAALYYLLVVAMLAMVSLELARDHAAQLGLGLLPFSYVGILAAAVVHRVWRLWALRVASALFWLLLAVAMAVKVAVYAREGAASRTGAQHKYPVSDAVTDNAVMVGVEVFLAVGELVLR